MPTTRPAAAPQPPPSSVSIGKKPMAYPPQTAAQQQQQRSARAASKAPVAYPVQQQGQQPAQPHHHPSPPSSTASGPGKGKAPAGATSGTSASSKPNKIWSTSTTEERERIKEFWLGLGEEERRNLVKIEKDTVLRKMKEQQKHSCSCAVCGRKRNAIEEELEVLYDAYYEELEQYANYQQRYVLSGGTLPPPPGPGPFPGSVELDKNGAVVGHHPPAARAKTKQVNGRKTAPPPVQPPHLHPHTHPHPHVHPHGKESEFDDDDDGAEDEYEEEEEEEEYEEEEDDEGDEDDEGEDEELPRDTKPIRRGVAREPPPPTPQRPNGIPKVADGFFNLKNSLTVTGPGNILTVADDLLKNDGQKFLEMMEQLAERRMQREEEAAGDVEDDSDEDDDGMRRRGDEDDDDEDDEDEDDEDDEDDDDEEEEEEEEMTEEQKSEEGKRMFSIFAARMFEQRVLQAYREKVAQERQLQLLRELEDEDKASKEREAKKQTANQKKKDKRKQQKLAKDEEKAAKAAEKAAEEAAQKARQSQQEEENKKKREEERARKEAAKKAAEEERAKKEEEKRKRLLEEKEREAERERKKREKEERVKAERREREEKERKAKEEKEARLAKEREERLERERLEKEKAEKARLEKLEKEQAEKAEREKEREKRLAKEREEKAERDARERLMQSPQRNVVSPTANGKSASGRAANRNAGAAASSSSSSNPQRVVPGAPPTVNGTNKKMANKLPPLSPSASAPVLGQPSRLQQPQPQQQPRATPASSQPQTPLTPQVPNHLPLQSPMMYPGQMIPPPISPRVQQGFISTYGFGPLQQHQQQHPGQPGLAPSALPRNFAPGTGQAFDPPFSAPRGMPISPIGPPQKTKAPTPLSTSPSAPSVLGQGRRGSILSGDPGPIAPPGNRPIIAPIARPSISLGTTNSNGEGSSSSSSPIRSPSPKGVLGSSALVEDGDEVFKAPLGRRGGAAPMPIGAGLPIGSLNSPVSLGGQTWGPASPRNVVSAGGQWGATGFASSPQQQRPIGPPPVGPLNTSHHPGGLWGNAANGANGGQDWHVPASPFFNSPHTSQFPVGLNTTSPPPSTGNST
ncbi:hypothetical protein H0H93_016560 [Arthromyces matolae]|nr:hypothetical protein H0H93_016560 [Arthromyces matolae]